MAQYNIGRDDSNHIVIPSSKIGKQHARLTVDAASGGILLEDLGSANGTFVNGRQVLKIAIAAGDKIQLADQVLDLKTHFVLKDGLPVRSRKPNDFSEEFQVLRDVYEQYQAQKGQIEAVANKKQRVLKAVVQQIPLVGPMVSALFLGSNKPPKAAAEQLEDLMIEFQFRYICPKCNRPLSPAKPWKFYAKIGKCEHPSCGAIYAQAAESV